MSPEIIRNGETILEGRHRLNLIGYGSIAQLYYTPTGGGPTTTIEQHFDEHCGPHAAVEFDEFEKMSKDDPEYEESLLGLQGMAQFYYPDAFKDGEPIK